MSEEPGLKPAASVAVAEGRLTSVDALRGFDMFWIIGAGGIVDALDKLSGSKTLKFIETQLTHVKWEGFRFYDLIFPLFVFLIGVSIVFSLDRIIERSGKAVAYRRIVRRFILLYVLGILYYGGMAHTWPDIRLVGVLQRLALCYLFASLIYCNFRWKGILLACAGLLVGYWALMSFVPVPGVGAGHFEVGKNLANYIDQHYLPGKKWDKTWDPEGLLSTLPAIGTCLIGVFAGMLLKNASVRNWQKVLCLLFAGAACVALGYLWGRNFPVIKKIWSSSYVLVAGGYSLLLLGFFFLTVDVWGLKKWARPFVWIGMNPLTLYLASNVIDFDHLALRFVGGNVKNVLGQYDELAVCIVSLGFILLLAWFLHRKRVFLRV
jgi:predicted acyltransferase